jgi:glycosyltransferase involved in cell wall biosynthesis
MRISIVTIGFNPGPSLARTIASVISQQHSDKEWIVIDGGSRDGSLDLYRAASEYINVMISEPDNGIADAMNKGIARTTGQAVLMLNAGDALEDEKALSLLAETMERTGAKWVVGGAAVSSEEGQFLYARIPDPKNVDGLLLKGCRIFHASVLLAKSLHQKYGNYDDTYSLAMDYEWWLRLWAAGERPVTTERVVSHFFLGGTSGNVVLRNKEDRRARTQHGLSRGLLGEIMLSLRARLTRACSYLKRFSLAYRIKERLG